MGMDEISLSGPSQIAEVRHNTVTEYTITPEQFGLNRAPLTALAGGSAADNAIILNNIFAGTKGPPRDVVLLNAAAVLVVSGLAPNLQIGVTLAAQTIDTGAVKSLLSALQTN